MTGPASASRRRAIGFMASTAATLAVPPAVSLFSKEALAQAASIGSWSPVYHLGPAGLGIVAIHTSLLPNRKLLVLQDDNLDYPRRGSGYVVGYVIDIPTDGAPGDQQKVENTQINLFCSGHAFMADGKLFFTGGNISSNVGASGSTIFDYKDNSWETNIDLPASYGRWYGSAITLPSGEILTVSGSVTSGGDRNPLPQVWSSTTVFRNLTGAVREIENYPSLIAAPNGRVFRAGSEQQCLWLSTTGSGGWSTGPSKKRARKYGPVVPYQTGRLIAIGGGLRTGDNPTNTAEVINLSASSPTWQYTGSMRWPRRHASGVALPDGTVLVVGGTRVGVDNNDAYAVLEPELWSPSTGQWTLMARMQKPRVYHSTALLLPDGRVFAAGSGRGSNADSEPNCEIFSPPYLFKGVRPSITSPETIKYGSTFTISTPDAQGIASVCLIRLGSVTHTVNFNQRRGTLAFTRGSGSLAVTMRTNRSNFPPGHYMLFVVNTDGVPSVAPIVRVA